MAKHKLIGQVKIQFYVNFDSVNIIVEFKENILKRSVGGTGPL